MLSPNKKPIRVGPISVYDLMAVLVQTIREKRIPLRLADGSQLHRGDGLVRLSLMPLGNGWNEEVMIYLNGDDGFVSPNQTVRKLHLDWVPYTTMDLRPVGELMEALRKH